MKEILDQVQDDGRQPTATPLTTYTHTASVPPPPAPARHAELVSASQQRHSDPSHRIRHAELVSASQPRPDRNPPMREILDQVQDDDRTPTATHQRRKSQEQIPDDRDPTAPTPRIFMQKKGSLRSRLPFSIILRKERDSNPRTLAGQRFSRPPHSTALPSFLCRPWGCVLAAQSLRRCKDTYFFPFGNK